MIKRGHALRKNTSKSREARRKAEPEPDDGAHPPLFPQGGAAGVGSYFPPPPRLTRVSERSRSPLSSPFFVLLLSRGEVVAAAAVAVVGWFGGAT